MQALSKLTDVQFGASAPVNGSVAIVPPSVQQAPIVDQYAAKSKQEQMKEAVKKRVFDPMTLIMDVGIGAMYAFSKKKAGKSPIPMLLGIPALLMAGHALGAVLDFKWDEKHHPTSKGSSIGHEVLKPSGLMDFIYLGMGISAMRKPGMQNNKMYAMLLCGLPIIGIGSRAYAGSQKFDGPQS